LIKSTISVSPRSDFLNSKDISIRGETEIVDLINYYLSKGKLQNKTFGRGFAWFDTGTHSSLLEASQFVETIERRQGYKVACLEEIAYSAGFISKQELSRLIDKYPDNEYGHYLQSILDD
jgi:glucose-1-phosphate thymidylyltransferase